MRNVAKITLLLLWGCFVPVGRVYAEPWVVDIGHRSEPFAFYEEERLVGGLLYDFLEAFRQEVGIELSYRNIPTKRAQQEFREGNIHLQVFQNPNWWEDILSFYWSPVLLVEDVNIFVVSAKHAFPIKTLDGLHGKYLGTIRGYVYMPELMKKFDQQDIFREDVATLEQNFKKLEAGRIDCLLDTRLQILWYLKKHNAQEQYVIAEFIETAYPLYMGFSEQISVSKEQMNTTLQHLKDRGIIAEILSKYK